MTVPTCARCGMTPPDGLATAGFDHLCHPDDPTHTDCYLLVTLSGEALSDGRTWNGITWDTH